MEALERPQVRPHFPLRRGMSRSAMSSGGSKASDSEEGGAGAEKGTAQNLFLPGISRLFPPPGNPQHDQKGNPSGHFAAFCVP